MFRLSLNWSVHAVFVLYRSDREAGNATDRSQECLLLCWKLGGGQEGISGVILCCCYLHVVCHAFGRVE